MAITINGSGTITGISAGGLPDGSVTAADLASSLDLSSKTVSLTPDAGQVVQTVIYDASVLSGEDIETSTTPAATRLAVTITPQYADSKLIVSATFNGKHDNGGSASNGSIYFIYRDGAIISSKNGHQFFYSSQDAAWASWNKHRSISIRGVVTAGSTSATTFKIYQKAFQNGNCVINYDWGISTIQVMEIKQ